MNKEYKLSPAELTMLGGVRDQVDQARRVLATMEGAYQGVLQLLAAQQGFKGEFRYEAGVLTQEIEPDPTPAATWDKLTPDTELMDGTRARIDE